MADARVALRNCTIAIPSFTTCNPEKHKKNNKKRSYVVAATSGWVEGQNLCEKHPICGVREGNEEDCSRQGIACTDVLLPALHIGEVQYCGSPIQLPDPKIHHKKRDTSHFRIQKGKHKRVHRHLPRNRAEAELVTVNRRGSRV